MTEVVSFKKEEGMYENCFSNFCEISAYFRRSYFWNTVNQRLCKSCPASSNKTRQTRIAPHILRLTGLIT
ncbi:hypothetical protein KYX73_10545, partial [Enterococcus faecium]|uniref:hypothetical protein n=1 Tax=Enterococcus faecium TaxID=1352 RepID=UPI001C7E08D6